MMEQAFWPLIGLAFVCGTLFGFSLWEAVDRSKWAAYRRAYRHCYGSTVPEDQA